MSYTGNYRIDAVLLVVINDGDGSQCGRSYKERLQIARWASRGSLWPWRLMLIEASKHVPGARLNDAERSEGALFLRDYYLEQIKEGA
jgi:hypothetical protein